MKTDELPLFVHWEKTAGEILDRTQKFPKSVRFTFSSRIDNLVLDILESVVEACYSMGPSLEAVAVIQKQRFTASASVHHVMPKTGFYDS